MKPDPAKDGHTCRIGGCVFYLKQYGIKKVPGSNLWYRHWYDQKIGQNRKKTLKTDDLDKAKDELIRFVELESVEPDQNPLLTTLLHQFIEIPAHRDYWMSDMRAFRPSLEKVALTVTVSMLSEWIMKDLWDDLKARGYSTGYMGQMMAMLRAAITWGSTPDRAGVVRTSYKPVVISSVKQICKHLGVDEPEKRNWHPETDEMAEILRFVKGDELMRRYFLLALTFGARAEATMEAHSDQLKWTQFNLKSHLHPAVSNKHRAYVPVPPSTLHEIRSWGEGFWVLNKWGRRIGMRRLNERFDVLKERFGMPKLVPTSTRDFVATTLRHADLDYGVPMIPENQCKIWQGHLKDEVNAGYGKFRSDYLIRPKLAIEAMLRDLDRRSGGVLFRQGPDKTPIETLWNQAHGKKRVLGSGFSEDNFSRENPGRTGENREKTAPNGSLAGIFRQVSAKADGKRERVEDSPESGDFIAANITDILSHLDFGSDHLA